MACMNKTVICKRSRRWQKFGSMAHMNQPIVRKRITSRDRNRAGWLVLAAEFCMHGGKLQPIIGQSSAEEILNENPNSFTRCMQQLMQGRESNGGNAGA
eukprot:15171610-Ditylum_brightwellii.AAC.1